MRLFPHRSQAKLKPDEEQALAGLEHAMVLLLGRIDKVGREGGEPSGTSRKKLSPCTTTVQFRRGDSSSLEEISFPWTSREAASFACTSPTQLSPPPLNEAESLRWHFGGVGVDGRELVFHKYHPFLQSLRLKLLAEEEELAATKVQDGQKQAGGEWARWLAEKQEEILLGRECVPGDLKLLSAELERCDTSENSNFIFK